MFSSRLIASAARILTSGSGSFSSSVIATENKDKMDKCCTETIPHYLETMFHKKADKLPNFTNTYTQLYKSLLI